MKPSGVGSDRLDTTPSIWEELEAWLHWIDSPRKNSLPDKELRELMIRRNGGDSTGIKVRLLSNSPYRRMKIAEILESAGTATFLEMLCVGAPETRRRMTEFIRLLQSAPWLKELLDGPLDDGLARAFDSLWRDGLFRTGGVRGEKIIIELLGRLPWRDDFGSRIEELARKDPKWERILHDPSSQIGDPLLRSILAMIDSGAAPVTIDDRLKAFIKTVRQEAGKKPAARPARRATEKTALKKIPDRRGQKPEWPDEPIFLNNAGLVLLAPFLPRYHQANGLVDDDKFKNAAAAARAACLLQMIVTPEIRVPEYEMPLNKILCGVDMTKAMNFEFVPTETERSNAGMLLKSVMQAWPKLSDTSVQGFRNSFLLRRGRLAREDEKWKLLVEKRGYDVLLTTIPWSFSVIRHSWMDLPLFVEWI